MDFLKRARSKWTWAVVIGVVLVLGGLVTSLVLQDEGFQAAGLAALLLGLVIAGYGASRWAQLRHLEGPGHRLGTTAGNEARWRAAFVMSKKGPPGRTGDIVQRVIVLLSDGGESRAYQLNMHLSVSDELHQRGWRVWLSDDDETAYMIDHTGALWRGKRADVNRREVRRQYHEDFDYFMEHGHLDGSAGPLATQWHRQADET